jgi:hypothetical protein
MWRTITAAAVLITLTAACSGDDSEADASADTPTTIDPDTRAGDLPGVSDQLEDMGIPPKPDQATADAYIAALVAIDPGIVYRGGDTTGDADTAINRGRDQCSTIHANPDDRARQIETTAMRFTSPDAPDGWDPTTAERILDVVHQHLCPDS